jgi:hypothetical protein
MERVIGVWFAMLAAGCFAEAGDPIGADDDDATTGCAPGEIGCMCRADGGCDAPGNCEDELCVGPVSPADDASDDDGATETTAPATSDDTTSDDTTTGDVPACGNGVLDELEECDDAFGCVACQLEHYTCNPLNQAGCAPTQTCDLIYGATLADQRTACWQEGRAELLGYCEYNALDPNLQCADGLSCVAGGYVPGCAHGSCCTRWCDLLDTAACDAPAECLTWKEPTMPPGLDGIGLCIAL